MVARGWGKRGMENYWLMGIVSVLQDEKSFGDWTQNNVNVFDIYQTVHLKMVNIVNFMLCLFYQSFLKGREG